jgi:AcrR family transcriptional regulator
VPRDSPGDRPRQPDELARLPHGRHGLPPEFVEHNQRQRLLASLIRTVAALGYNGVTIANLAEGAGVTTRTFYKYFDSVSACYMAAFDVAAGSLAERLAEAYGGEDPWPQRVRAALGAALDFFAAEPAVAALLLTEPFVAGPDLAGHYQQGIEAIAGRLREGRDHFPEAAAYPESTERGLVGSIASQIGRKSSGSGPEALPDLLPELTQFALTPYLGVLEARRVALEQSD